jgi:hypothetical protein
MVGPFLHRITFSGGQTTTFQAAVVSPCTIAAIDRTKKFFLNFINCLNGNQSSGTKLHKISRTAVTQFHK